jgi:regulator of sirC expression with transglutaminase-like and TPR domain
VETLFDRQNPRAKELLSQALDASPERLDLAALAVAALEHPEVDVQAVEQSLERLADQVRARIGTSTDATEQISALRDVLAGQEGFHGEDEGYSDAENSFLDKVLERHRGLPIALGVIYVEVARRVGLPLHGVSFPGHFLVGADAADSKVILDPFHDGKSLSLADCSALLKRFAPHLRMAPTLLAPASVRVVTARMLSNLKTLYLAQGQGERALRVVDLLLALTPDHPGELRIRAALLSALGAYRAALADVERCLKLTPAAQDAHSLQLAAKSLRERVEYLN